MPSENKKASVIITEALNKKPQQFNSTPLLVFLQVFSLN